jgi:dihydrofolate reductase
MRKIVATEYVTLDGVMHEPGQWSGPFFNDEAVKFKYDELFASDALLLGRVTYEGFAKAWPKMTGTGDFGERMNGMPKYVVSTTLDKAEWNNSTIIRDNVVEEIGRLKEQPGQDILVYGSGRLTNSLIEHNLLDELRLWVHPVVLGRGQRMFPEGSRATLKLAGTTTLGTGVVILTYGLADR